METCPPPIIPQCHARSTGLGNTLVNNLIQAVLTAYCEIVATQQWPLDAGTDYIKRGTEVFDFIVVGGGTAGALVAGRLSENPHYRVLLIEAGDDPPIESTIPGLQTSLYQVPRTDWMYDAPANGLSCNGFPSGKCIFIRGKCLGGSSAVNAMFAVRGNRRDFDEWEAWGNPGWGWDSVLPYFRKTENFKGPNPYGLHGTNGPLVINQTTSLPSIYKMLMKATKQAGYDVVNEFRDGHFLGTGPIDMIVNNGTRNTPASVFLKPTIPNLMVIKNAIVTKINFDHANRARSVNFVYTDPQGVVHELVAESSKEIVISAGTIETPKLLMLSGIGPSEHLRTHNIPVRSDLPVGDNYHDHSLLGLYFKLKSNEKPDIHNATYNYFIHRNDTLFALNAVYATSFFDIRKESGKYPNIQIHYVFFPRASNISDIFGLVPATYDALSEALKENDILLMNMVLLQPKSRGNIRLRSNDYRHQPIINHNYLSDYDDVKLYVEAVKTLLEFEKTPVFRKYDAQHIAPPIPGCEHAPIGSDAYWECYVRHVSSTISHYVGTAKMGPNEDPSTVVDSQLRVRGVKRLRVVDASIMPRVPSGNTMLATTMIGEKAADFIKQLWMSPF